MALPKSWKEISISKFIEVYTITNTIKDPIDQEIHLIACLSGQTYKEVENYTVSKLTKESAKLLWMKELPVNEKLAASINYKGFKYKACLTFTDMTAGQFIDFSTICNGVKNEDMINHCADLIGCLVQQRKMSMKPPFITYEYIGYSHTDFSDMDMETAYPYYVFFCKVLTISLRDIQNYSLKKATKELKKVRKILKKTSTNTGGGSRQ